jgi:hypothetical protein
MAQQMGRIAMERDGGRVPMWQGRCEERRMSLLALSERCGSLFSTLFFFFFAGLVDAPRDLMFQLHCVLAGQAARALLKTKSDTVVLFDMQIREFGPYFCDH